MFERRWNGKPPSYPDADEEPAGMRGALPSDGTSAPDEGPDDADPHHEIARLETRIEELSETLDRCRKIMLASRVAIAAGAMWIAAAILGIVAMDPLPLMAAIAAVLGGTVTFGSNMTTARQISAAIREAEARRAALIGRLRLRVIGERPPGL